MNKVIYRKYRDGKVIALFPQIAADVCGYKCQSYMHAGQHGAANPMIVVQQTKLAALMEYDSLHQELEWIGYNPIPAKRFTRKDYEIRRAQYKG